MEGRGWLPCWVDGCSKLQRRLSLFGHVRLVCIRKRDGLDIAEANALRISVAIIALHGDPFLDIKERVAEGACDDARSASNTQIFVDGHPVIIFWLPVASLCRTNLDAVGFFTVVAGHGKI
jgi:hypothetical protein